MPVREMRSDLGEIRNIADVISYPIRVVIRMAKRKAHPIQQVDGLQDRNAIRPSAPEIVDLPATRIAEKFQKNCHDVVAMDLIAHLFALVAIDGVLAPAHGAMDDIGEVTV